MTRHALGPFWVKMKYTSLARTKHALYPCAVDGSAIPGVEPELTTRGSGAVAATTCLANWVNAIKASFNSADSFDSYEIYHQPTPTDPITLVYAAVLGLHGSSTAADVPYSEAVWTFKTPNPGGLKVYLMETIIPVDSRVALPVTGNPVVNDPAAFISSDNNWILGRNGNMPLIPLFMTSKQNDHYRRKYKL